MNVLSLCSGVAGLDLGIRLAYPEARTVALVEREAHAAAVLVARMQDGALDQAPVWSDLTTFDGKPWRGVVDLVAAGYPCQPFSFAGQRGGTDDPRHLWPHVARIIGECGAAWAFLENVPGHLSLGFREVCGELRGMGFTVAAGVFSAAEVGAPHRRERLFALAYRDHDGHDGCRSERHRGEPQPQPAGGGARLADATSRDGQRETSGPAGHDALGSEGMDDTNGAGLSRRLMLAGDKSRERNPWPPGPRGDWSGIPESLWPATTQSRVRGVADGLASRVDRLRACGNGVVSLAAAHAFRALSASLAGCVTHMSDRPTTPTEASLIGIGEA